MKTSKRQWSEASPPASSVPRAAPIRRGWTRGYWRRVCGSGRWTPKKPLEILGSCDSSAQNNFTVKRNHWPCTSYRQVAPPQEPGPCEVPSGSSLGVILSIVFLKTKDWPSGLSFQKGNLTPQKAGSVCCWHQGHRKQECLADWGHVLISDMIRVRSKNTRVGVSGFGQRQEISTRVAKNSLLEKGISGYCWAKSHPRNHRASG